MISSLDAGHTNCNLYKLRKLSKDSIAVLYVAFELWAKLAFTSLAVLMCKLPTDGLVFALRLVLVT